MNFRAEEKTTAAMAVNLITRQIQFIFMKKFIGLFILVIVLVAVSGCTQQAKPPATATTVPTTAAAAVTTMQATPEPTTAAATVQETVTAEVTTLVPTVATPKPTMAPSTKITTIHIRNNIFVPNELTVLPGTRITWINDDPVNHIVKATGDHKGMFTSSEIISGASFGYDFSQLTGRYEFTDPAYPGMNGTIIIQKGESLVGAPTQQPSATP
jgi:plastocyanin